MIRTFRQKPVKVEAVQFTYPPSEELLQFCPPLTVQTMTLSGIPYGFVKTAKGTFKVLNGDWIVKFYETHFRVYSDVDFHMNYIEEED